MRNKNSTPNGEELKKKHQATYERWWLGKYFVGFFHKKDRQPQKIINVEYIGNSVYGVVRLTLADGTEVYPMSNGYKPLKSDISVIENI